MRINITCHAPDCECENTFELVGVVNASRATGFDRGARLRCVECESIIPVSEQQKDKVLVAAIEELESALLTLAANRWNLDQGSTERLEINIKG